MKTFYLSFLLFAHFYAAAQIKKPLSHSVYDNWKSVGERMISNDGKFVLYAINSQEGDGDLIIQSLNSDNKLTFSNGYNGVFSDDSRFAVLKMKPAYQDTRQAKIKKKKPDEMPKDSLVIINLSTKEIQKVGRVKSYRLPEKGSGWLAYQSEKSMPDTTNKRLTPDSVKARIDMLTKLADSLIRESLDSVKGKIEKEELVGAAQKAVKVIYKKANDLLSAQYGSDAEADDATVAGPADYTDLVLKNLLTNSTITFKQVSEYLFDKKGTKLLVEIGRNLKDSNSKAYILLYDLRRQLADTVMRSFNDAKSFSFDDQGSQLVFAAERDSGSKALQKFYKLWYFQPGMDSAKLMVKKNTVGMQLGYTVSEYGNVSFSKDGTKLFFGVAPIQPARDTTLVDFELARLDIWHYNDDYLQPQQLKQLTQEQRRSYLAVINLGTDGIIQLANENAENASVVDEGNADWVLVQSSKGNRIASQWEGRSKNTAYVVSTSTGKQTTVIANSYGAYVASPSAKYVYWYNPEAKNYFTYNISTGAVKNVSLRIREALYDMKNDVPDFPSPSGIIGWTANDEAFLVKDNYDIWQLDPDGISLPVNITAGYGKEHKTEFTYVKLDPEKRFLLPDETIVLQAQDKVNKYGGYFTKNVAFASTPVELSKGPFDYSQLMKARNTEEYIVQRTNISESELMAGSTLSSLRKLTNIAAQQDTFNWLTAELLRWKMFDGNISEGILYKPEDFDPHKKYPIIFYFYERNSDGLFSYKSPAPSASTINIPYFVSNGYLVFDPNIYYKTGEPGQSAFNSVVSAARYLAKMPWVDSNRMAIQGQSWGGYQVAYLVTKTKIFRAASAGAPVANMTSAYGGIRWGTGLNRQFQYEKTQSRIGATLWQRPDLYIKNSPLFAADKVMTPLLIMHNDADGSVPWYQGIEFFTALRRLGKKVWMLEYNGEDHNLVERRNKKDLSIRLAQFFDYYLKDARPARWIKDGLPATEKGRDWGFEVD